VSDTGPDGAVAGNSYDGEGQFTETSGSKVTAQVYDGARVTARPVRWTGYDTFGDVAEARPGRERHDVRL
jgi:hypothetical protein